MWFLSVASMHGRRPMFWVCCGAVRRTIIHQGIRLRRSRTFLVSAHGKAQGPNFTKAIDNIGFLSSASSRSLLQENGRDWPDRSANRPAK